MHVAQDQLSRRNNAFPWYRKSESEAILIGISGWLSYAIDVNCEMLNGKAFQRMVLHQVIAVYKTVVKILKKA
jgi:hypothetical protein